MGAARELNRTLRAAIEYHELGLSVLPLIGKAPVVSDWSRIDPLSIPELRRYFGGRTSRYNIGLRMGNGLVALDVDEDADGYRSRDRLFEEGEVPLTAKARTGGGGEHYLFWTPRPIGCFQGVFGWPGLDVRGVGGQIVVEPSIHPDTGRPYVWARHPGQSIATLPGWLLDRLSGWSVNRKAGRVERGRGENPGTIRSDRTGDVAALVAEAVARFPIPGPGHRGKLFAELVPSLVGRGFADDITSEVVVSWWAYHHAGGLCRTGADDADRETRAYIDLLRASERFGPASSAGWHREQCRQVEVPVEALERLSRSAGTRTESHLYTTVGVTLTNHRLCNRVCVSEHERAFVEALLVRAIHEAEHNQDGTIRFTGDQLREVAADRHPGLVWRPQQLERLKAKYIDRPDKPASRCSLLRQVKAGNRATTTEPARPSVYEVTGLAGLLAGLA